MQSIDAPATIIGTCKAQILATKAHSKSSDTDTDLTLSGQDRPTYRGHAAAVRKEYALYAGMLNNPGRKAVLNHFLHMDRIIKTEPFFMKLEKRARENLLQELEELP